MAIVAMFSVFLFSFAHADRSVGEVERIMGDVIASSFYGSKRQLGSNDLIYQGDILKTARDAEVLITFKDGSNFLISENSEVTIDEMLYDRFSQEGRFIVRLIRGALLIVSGELKHKDQGSMQVRTNLATMGIRGTKAFVQVLPDEEKFVLLEPEKNETSTSIHVSSQWGGTLVDKINHGSILKSGQAPTSQSATNLGEIDTQFSLLERPSRRKFAVTSAQEIGFIDSLWRVVKQRLE